WRLPIHGGFDAFETILDCPFVARHADPSRSRQDVLRALHLPSHRRIALMSFGGYGTKGLALDALDCLDDWTVVLTGRPEDRRHAGRLRIIADSDIYDAGLRYCDLVHAADVVVTKPGYGIVSECIANDTAIVYTPRGRFAEYPVMVREMPKYLRCAPLDNESLLAGRWREALDRAVHAPPPPARPRTHGADVIAEMMGAAVSRQLSAHSFQLTAFSSQLSALGFQLTAFSSRLSALGFRLTASSSQPKAESREPTAES